MKQTEDNLSFAGIKQYILLLKNDLHKFETIEFKTCKEWLIYSLALTLTFCMPSTIILFITGYLSGGIPVGLLVLYSLIPFIFILPLIFILTYFKNYKKPKKLRKQILQGLERCEWDGSIKQVGQVEFECIKNHYLFSTEARLAKNYKGTEQWFIYMYIPFNLPDEVSDREEYIQQIDTYLEEKCRFDLDQNVAYIAAPVGLFASLDLHKDIEQLLYVMQRFRLLPRTLYNPHTIINQIPRTIELLALTIYKQEIDDRWPAWANDLIDRGFSNENLIDFARQTPLPGNQQQLRVQMSRIIREFNLDIFCGKYTLSNYINYLVQKKLEKELTVPEIVGLLNSLYLSAGLPDLQNFNLLHKAVTALNETGRQDIWTITDLSAENMEVAVLEYLDTFFEDENTEP